MSSKTCLRCDWEGDTSEPTCPNCGTKPLYVAEPSRSKERERVGRRGGSSDRAAGVIASTTPPPFPSPQPDVGRPMTDPLGPVRGSDRVVGPFVVVALLIAATVVTWLTSNEPRTAAVPPRESSSPIFSTPSPARVDPIARLLAGENALNVDGVPFSFIVRTPGWFRFDGISINKSTAGPQAAEAMIFWTAFPDGDHADPCPRLLSPSIRPSVADLAAAVSTAPGTGLVAGPSHVTVGGRPAEYVVLSVRKNVGCDPGFFFAWNEAEAGPFWSTTAKGSMIRVWIVDVEDTVLFVGAETRAPASPDLWEEVDQIVRSIRFHEAVSVVVPNP
jgi:hypothetical protein